VTVLVTILAMWLVGLSLNLMTLGGMAAAMGLVIDDAIVVVENIYIHFSRGLAGHHAVQRAISEISVPIIGSTVTPVVVFLPLTLLSGVTGVFFRSLALTMAVALLTSLVLALAFTPVLAERFIKPKRSSANPSEAPGEGGQAATGLGAEARQQGRILSVIIRRYETFLEFALDHGLAVIAVIGVVALGSYIIYERLGSEFLPEFDEGAFA
jgi:multidrug efflux pump subunit AcrB